MKKLYSILIAAFVAGAIGAACGGGSKTPAGDTMPTNDMANTGGETGGDSYGGDSYGGDVYGGSVYGM